MTDWFVFGAGFSGLEAGRQIAATGAKVAGTTRTEAKFDRLQKAGIEPFLFSGHLDAPVAFNGCSPLAVDVTSFGGVKNLFR